MRKNKGLLLLALVALGAFTITATIGGSASASGGNAVAAKKKCKKKKASSAKKKKCKKKKGAANTPLVRATLTWSNGGASDVDMDLFAFDASGHQAGNGADTIPQSTISPDLTGPQGSETFTDLAFNQKRPLSYGVCYLVGGSVDVEFVLTYVTADGVTHTFTAADDLPPGPNQRAKLGSAAHLNFPGGAPIPDNYCPGTSLIN
jgi:hypothetical protein